MDTFTEHAAVTFVREQLKSRAESMTDIARATGVSKRWLEMIQAGEIPKPGIQNLELVARHFGHVITVRKQGK